MKRPLMEFLTPLFHKLLLIRHAGTRNLGALNELALLQDGYRFTHIPSQNHACRRQIQNLQSRNLIGREGIDGIIGYGKYGRVVRRKA